MRILYFSQFYTPESIAPAFRATDNSKIWVKLGHEVTVFTGYPNYPKGKIFDGYIPKLLTIEQINDVRVIRSKLIAKPNNTIVRRLENALSYFFFGMINIIFNVKKIGTDYDVVLGTSGVIFNALLAYIFSKIHHLKFVFEIRDITYIQMQATGKDKGNFTTKIMKAIELFLCKHANKVVVVTNGFKKILINDGIEQEKIVVITNGVDVKESTKSICSEEFVLSYFGTLGISQNIIETFKYAEYISKLIDNFEYLIIGEGAQKKEIKNYLNTLGNSFVNLMDGMPSEDLESYYTNTQLSVITLRKTENFKYTIPSKLFQIMGRGIAVLFIGPKGETSDIIEKYNAGLSLTGTFEEDKLILKKFFERPDWKEKMLLMGKNGRQAVLNNYSRTKLAKKYIDILDEVGAYNE